MSNSNTSNANKVCIPVDKTTTQTKKTSTVATSGSGGADTTSHSSTSTKVVKQSNTAYSNKSGSNTTVSRSTNVSPIHGLLMRVQNFFNKAVNYNYSQKLRSMLTTPLKIGGLITIPMMAAVGAGAISLLLCYLCVKNGWCAKIQYHMMNCYNKMRSKFYSWKKCILDQSTSDSIRPVEPVVQRGYTKEELAMYDGVHNNRILVSIKRKVYEVGHQFYGPGQDYHIFAGKDVSRCMAKATLSESELNKYWANCSEEELQRLEEYVRKFDSKYPVVGWFVADNSFFQV